MKNTIPVFKLTLKNFKNLHKENANYGVIKVKNLSQINIFSLVKRAIEKNFKHLKEDAYKENGSEKITLFLNQNAGYKRRSGSEKSLGLFTNKYEFDIKEGEFSVKPTFLELLLDKNKQDEKIFLSKEYTENNPTIFDESNTITISQDIFQGIEDKTNAVINVIAESVLNHILNSE